MKIVFFGTPDFGLPALRLLANQHQVAAVVTAADKPSGRGGKLIFSPIKQAALQMNIKILQPENLKSDDFIHQLSSINADIFVVIAFRMLPERVWNLPPLGSINLHASLLPAYRGAAPINWAIINGERQTGLTTFSLQHQIDTGDIWFQETQIIEDNDDFGSLYQKLSDKGGPLVLKTLAAITDGSSKPIPQKFDSDAPSAPKINKQTGILTGDKTAEQIQNLIRGLSPSPAVVMYIGSNSYKIFAGQATQVLVSEPERCGSFQTDQKSHLWFAASDFWVNITLIRPDGRKTMSVSQYLLGSKFDI